MLIYVRALAFERGFLAFSRDRSLTLGLCRQALWATSKDVTIGPVAVMSLQVSKVIAHVQAKPGGDQYPGHIIATTLALICGCAVLGMGLLRLGFLVEFIPAPAIAGFMTVSCACPLLSPPPSFVTPC